MELLQHGESGILDLTPPRNSSAHIANHLSKIPVTMASLALAVKNRVARRSMRQGLLSLLLLLEQTLSHVGKRRTDHARRADESGRSSGGDHPDGSGRDN